MFCLKLATFALGKLIYLSSPSALRKLHDSVADPKYEGVKTSRKHIFDDDDSDEDAMEENPLDAALGADDGSDDGQSDGGEDSEGEEGSEQGDDVGDNDQGDHSDTRPSPPPKKVAFSKPAEKSDDLAATLKRSRDADRLKGKAVSRQLVNTVCLPESSQPSHSFLSTGIVGYTG